MIQSTGNLPGAAARFHAGILPQNPIFRQLLGMCPVLAVTNTTAGALTMGLATTFVLVSSNLIVSALRHALQPHLRILVYTVTIASLVTMTDRFLAAYFPEMSDLLGPYIPLIIVNCMIISRAEACASKQGLGTAFCDGLGQGLGFIIGMLALGSMRELLGSGGLFGYRLLPDIWSDWIIMVLPPGAFLTLGLLIALVNAWGARGGKNGPGANPKGESDG